MIEGLRPEDFAKDAEITTPEEMAQGVFLPWLKSGATVIAEIGTELLSMLQKDYDEGKAEAEEVKSELQEVIDEIAETMSRDDVSDSVKNDLRERSDIRIKRIRGKIMIAEANLDAMAIDIRTLKQHLGI